jgi:lipoic acid synthetase
MGMWLTHVPNKGRRGLSEDLLQIENAGAAARARKPPWLRIRLRHSAEAAETHALVKQLGINTVCEEAACPNLNECWSSRHVTVMILGSICTRACAFCNIDTGRPGPVDQAEPAHLAEVAERLRLAHMVITSVDRDDLADGGAGHFVACIQTIRERRPQTTLEVLTPDFRNKQDALEAVIGASPDVFNHNLETVPRLYRRIRPGASYRHSLDLLARARRLDPSVFTKSGIMVGLGEAHDEVLALMDDLREADVDFMTIGQYLRPTPRHVEVERYVTPEEFDAYAQAARERGFLLVSSTPLTRSSYHADEDFRSLRAAREQLLGTG